MPLFPFSEKAQPKFQASDTDDTETGSYSEQSQNASRSQTLTACSSTVGLGMSFGGVFNLLCAPVLAGSTGSVTAVSKAPFVPESPASVDASAQTLAGSLSSRPSHSPAASTTKLAPLANLFQEPTVGQPAAVSNTYNPVGAFSGSAHALATPLPSSKQSSSTQSLAPAAVSPSSKLPPTDLLSSTENLNATNTKLSLLEVPSLAASARVLKGDDGLLANTSSEADDKLIELMSHPALDHVGSAALGAEAATVGVQNNRDASVEESEATGSNGSRTPALPSSTNDDLGNLGIPLPTPDRDLEDTPVAQSSTVETVPDIDSLRDGSQAENEIDDELGNLRLQIQRSRSNEELGILRLLQTAQAPPPPPKPPIAFLSGRLGFFDSDNVFRSNGQRSTRSNGQTLRRLDEQIFQAGLTMYVFPKLSKDTSLYAIAGTSLARYDNNRLLISPGRRSPNGDPTVVERVVDYNQVELELGIRQRLFPRTYAQLGWRNQQLFSPGYKEKKFGVNYIDAQLTHRSILNARTWLDSFYQARVGFADPNRSSRFRQTFTLSLNHNLNRDLRTTLLYQLDLDDYTGFERYDVYQQVLGVMSYRLTPESRLSLFGGTRFGSSSEPNVNLDDTFYGAGLNVSIPLF